MLLVSTSYQFLLLDPLKLHALVEYETSDIAEKAVSQLFKNFSFYICIIRSIITLVTETIFLTWLGWEVKRWKELEERDASKATA